VVLQAAIESRARYIALAEAATRTVDLDRLSGCLVLVTPAGIRIRRP
jgi:hypothetical protein